MAIAKLEAEALSQLSKIVETVVEAAMKDIRREIPLIVEHKLREMRAEVIDQEIRQAVKLRVQSGVMVNVSVRQPDEV